MLIASRSAFSMVCYQSSVDHMAWVNLCHVALQQVLKWRLHMSRSQAWLAMEAKHGLLASSFIYSCSHSVSLRISNLPLPDLVGQLGSIPSALLHLVCCILTELYCDKPSLVRSLQPIAGVAAAFACIPLWRVLRQVLVVLGNSKEKRRAAAKTLIFFQLRQSSSS